MDVSSAKCCTCSRTVASASIATRRALSSDASTAASSRDRAVLKSAPTSTCGAEYVGGTVAYRRERWPVYFISNKTATRTNGQGTARRRSHLCHPWVSDRRRVPLIHRKERTSRVRRSYDHDAKRLRHGEEVRDNARLIVDDGSVANTLWRRARRLVPESIGGMALGFVHVQLHEGAPVASGRRYVLRTDVMYSPTGRTMEASSSQAV